MPLDKELISLAIQGKNQTKTTEQLISTIKYMVDANIPLNDIAFQSLLIAKNNDSFMDYLARFFHSLDKSKEGMDQTLIQNLATLLGKEIEQ